MPVGEVDIDREVPDPVTPDSDDSPRLAGWQKGEQPRPDRRRHSRISPGSRLDGGSSVAGEGMRPACRPKTDAFVALHKRHGAGRND